MLRKHEIGSKANAMSDLLEKFKQTYSDLGFENLEALRDLYSPQIHFIDPIHEVTGIEPLLAYCRVMYEKVESCRFTFEETLAWPGSAVIVWTMHLKHRTFRPGETLHLPGVSHIRFAERIDYHRDYYDAGAMLYERIPLMGSAIRMIKRRLGG